ncbi:MAG TPA: ABC transporter ATP-binding protein [Ilumatobacteraceae bacterium]|nr:ABC transporter ATP-binding protein [Ilumatobacteraceae bacterium]
MAAIDLEQVTVRVDRSARLGDVSMTIDDGALVAVVGGSGSGKTSLLRAIAGLDRIDRGRVRFDGRDVTRATPGDRDVGMVFQSPALIGHLSARRNVSFPLDVRRVGSEEIRQRVDAEMRALRIEELMDRAPSTLSVGEQQMVQIARALVRVPAVLLLDEPFASLDDQLRRRMRAEFAMLQSGYGVTTLMATNDSADVEALAGLVAVLEAGRLVQFGERDVVRRMPSGLSAAVATGAMSLIEMTVVAEQRGFWLVREDPAGGELIRIRSWSPDLAGHVGTTVTVGVRPEDAEIVADGTIPATVESTAQLGAAGIRCSVAGVRTVVAVPTGRFPDVGSQVRLRIHHHVVFDRSDDRTIGWQAGGSD